MNESIYEYEKRTGDCGFCKGSGIEAVPINSNETDFCDYPCSYCKATGKKIK